MKLMKKEKPVSQDGDDDVVAVDETPPLIEEGMYEVGFVRETENYPMFNARHVRLVFKILDAGPHCEKELCMDFRVEPRKGKKSMASSSKFVRAATVALGHPPTRNDRVSMNVFRGKAFRAIVRTVKKDAQRRPLPPVSYYSVVDMLWEKTAG